MELLRPAQRDLMKRVPLGNSIYCIVVSATGNYRYKYRNGVLSNLIFIRSVFGSLRVNLYVCALCVMRMYINCACVGLYNCNVSCISYNVCV